MDLKTCLKKMELVGVLDFATVAKDGSPQIRNMSAIHYEEDALYFLTAKGKNLCEQLLDDGRVQILCYTKFKEMIRMSSKVKVADNQEKYIDLIFKEQPYLANVYPEGKRDALIIFCIDAGEVEYFNLGVKPIFRETYKFGDYKIIEKGYFITDKCIGCNTCASVCPQGCIDIGNPYTIRQNNCLHCGSCMQNCPVGAIVKR